MTFFIFCLAIFGAKRFTNRNNGSRYPNEDRLRLFLGAALGDGNGGWLVADGWWQKRKKKRKREQGAASSKRHEARQTRRDRTVPNGEALREGKNFARFLDHLAQSSCWTSFLDLHSRPRRVNSQPRRAIKLLCSYFNQKKMKPHPIYIEQLCSNALSVTRRATPRFP